MEEIMEFKILTNDMYSDYVDCARLQKHSK